jgi:hypothetical protein
MGDYKGVAQLNATDGVTDINILVCQNVLVNDDIVVDSLSGVRQKNDIVVGGSSIGELSSLFEIKIYQNINSQILPQPRATHRVVLLSVRKLPHHTGCDYIFRQPRKLIFCMQNFNTSRKNTRENIKSRAVPQPLF